MNYRIVRIIRITVLLTCILGFLSLALCTAPVVEKVENHVSFSKESGFYTEDFFLELSCKQGTIYYTLDCSEPDENSLVYSAPLHISDASTAENRFCTITDVTPYFDASKPRYPGISNKGYYQIPEEPIDKATVVRAVCIDRNGRKSSTETAVYFVGFDDKVGYDGMGIISVVTTPENLFDPDIGIYVTGNADGSDNPNHYPGNYYGKGAKWEVPATIHSFDLDRNLILRGQFGLRIQGSTSRELLPKSLNLFFQKKSGTPLFLSNSLIEAGKDYTHIILASGGSTIETPIHDWLVNKLTESLNFVTRKYIPCVLFLDGEYWGTYCLTQKFSGIFFEEQYGIPEENSIMIKSGLENNIPAKLIEIGTEEDLSMFYTMYNWICENDMRDPERFQEACDMIDLESCIDYYAAELYIANVDWPHNNLALWRCRKPTVGTYCDGKWRWVLFDVNLSMNLRQSDKSVLQGAINQDPFFASMLENEEFEAMLKQRMVDLSKSTFAPSRVDNLVDEFSLRMVGPVTKSNQRFFGDNRSKDDFYEDCSNIKLFFRQRADFIQKTYGGEA